MSATISAGVSNRHAANVHCRLERRYGLTLIAATLLLLATVIVSFAEQTWTLDESISYALEHNPEARIATDRIAVARALLGQANAAFLPRLELRSSYTRTDNPATVFGAILNQQAFSNNLDFNDVPEVDNARIGGMVSLPLYAGGAHLAGRKAAHAGTAAARVDAEAVRNRLAFEVARTFYTVVKTRELIRATEAGVGAFETNLRVARNRLNSGTALKTDVLDVEVRLARSREELVRAQNARALALRALRNLLSTDQDEIHIADTEAEPSIPPTDDFAKRPELTAANKRFEAAQALVRAAKSGYLPQVDAFGSVDHDRGWELDSGAWSYTAGVTMQWNLWDGNRTRTRVDQARAELETAREQKRRVYLAVDLEVEQARIRVNDASQRLSVTEKAVAQATESAALTRSRFEQGLAISSQLIDAEAALTTASVRRAEALADRRIAIAALRSALGLPQRSGTRASL